MSMFHLESMMKTFDNGDNDDSDVPLTVLEAREIIREYSRARTALRRIKSLDDKNLAKYAKEIAASGL